MPRSVLWFRVKRLLVFKHCVFRRHACRIFNRRILNPFTITVADNLLDCRLFSVSKTENLPQLVWSFFHSHKILNWIEVADSWWARNADCVTHICVLLRPRIPPIEPYVSRKIDVPSWHDLISVIKCIKVQYSLSTFVVFFSGTELSGWNLHNFIIIGMLITSLFTQILKIISSPWLVPAVQPSY